MNILLPIVIASLLVGLFAKRLTWREWFFLIIVIIISIYKYYQKGA